MNPQPHHPRRPYARPAATRPPAIAGTESSTNQTLLKGAPITMSNNLFDPLNPTRAQAADDLKHTYARGRKILVGISDRLGVLAYRQEILGAEEATRIQQQLEEVDTMLCLNTVGEYGALPEECEEDQDAYSDGSPVFSLFRDFTAQHLVPPAYLPADIWDLCPGTEVIVEDPPHRRPATTRSERP